MCQRKGPMGASSMGSHYVKGETLVKCSGRLSLFSSIPCSFLGKIILLSLVNSDVAMRFAFSKCILSHLVELKS